MVYLPPEARSHNLDTPTTFLSRTPSLKAEQLLAKLSRLCNLSFDHFGNTERIYKELIVASMEYISAAVPLQHVIVECVQEVFELSGYFDEAEDAVDLRWRSGGWVLGVVDGSEVPAVAEFGNPECLDGVVGDGSDGDVVVWHGHYIQYRVYCAGIDGIVLVIIGMPCLQVDASTLIVC